PPAHPFSLSINLSKIRAIHRGSRPPKRHFQSLQTPTASRPKTLGPKLTVSSGKILNREASSAFRTFYLAGRSSFVNPFSELFSVVPFDPRAKRRTCVDLVVFAAENKLSNAA
ncbi:hypothetical protein, partial [Skermanella stibiiresistens]|uniref:hypothetical protein n=1 Tax=Skermanella stibiiresistens TaxID=913326 RepID=UPI001B3BCBFD